MNVSTVKESTVVMQAFSAGYPFKKIFLIKFKPSFHPRIHFFLFFLRKRASKCTLANHLIYLQLLT